MAQQAKKKEVFFYGIGDFACNGCFTIISSYLMFFYTDVACLPLAAVGEIILVSRAADALSCLAMGGLIDRTNTRWGKVRPYLAGIIIPLCLNLIAVFYTPGFSKQGKILYALFTSTMYSVLYSGLSVSYSTMMSCMTDDNKERLEFNLAKNISANLGAFFVTSITLSIVDIFDSTNAVRGFTLTMVFYSIIYTGIMFLCFYNVREKNYAVQEKLSLKESVRIAAKNRHWYVLCVIQFLMLLGISMRNQGTMYYAKYCLGKEELGTVLLSISTFLAIPMVFFVTKMAEKIGKKRCMSYGMIGMIIGIAGVYGARKILWVLLIFHILASMGWGIASGMVFVMIAEVVDYSEYQTGKRPQGFLTSVVSLMMKLGVACAGILSAMILEKGNYVAGTQPSDTALRAITANYIWIPGIVALLSLVMMQFYTLDAEYAQVVNVLENRRKEEKYE